MSKKLKRYLESDIKTRLGDDRDLIVLRLDKFDVEHANDLRNKLREGGARMTVLRNRVARIAFEDLGMNGAGDLLKGVSAMAHGGEDGVQGVSRVLKDWQKANKDGGIEVAGGYMEGKVLTPADVKYLADLPSRDQLLAMIASAVSAPMQQIAAQINELFAGIVRGVDAVREQKEGQSS